MGWNVALTNCKECDAEVSNQAIICPKCGISSPGIKKETAGTRVLKVIGTLYIAGWIVFFILVLSLVTYCSFSGSGKQSNAQLYIQTPASPQPPASVVQNVPDITPDIPDLADAEAAAAFSAYVGNIQGKMIAMAALNSIYLSKFKQDTEWKSLDKFREDAAALKDTSREQASEIDGINYPTNLTDQQAAQFAAVHDAASEWASDNFSMNVDFSVLADTGMYDDNESVKDAQTLKEAQQAFKDKVIQGYKFFGYLSEQIDMDSLTIKTDLAKRENAKK
jgi:hypothetical protein